MKQLTTEQLAQITGGNPTALGNQAGATTRFGLSQLGAGGASNGSGSVGPNAPGIYGGNGPGPGPQPLLM